MEGLWAELEDRNVSGAAEPCRAHCCFLATVMWLRGGEGGSGSAGVTVLVVVVNGDNGDGDIWTESDLTGTSGGNTQLLLASSLSVGLNPGFGVKIFEEMEGIQWRVILWFSLLDHCGDLLKTETD